MSEYENVVVGKLRLKGNALNVKSGGLLKKKKQKKQYEQYFTKNNTVRKQAVNMTDLVEKMNTGNNVDAGNEVEVGHEERLTPAERRYLEQWKQLEVKQLLKNATESHRDRIQKFNSYLANLSEHYDIPKVGPG